MLSGVIFDLFGTLTAGESNRDRHVLDLARALGAAPGDFQRLMRQTFDQRARGQLGGLRQTLGYLCDELGLSPSEAALDEATRIRMAGEREMLQPRDDAVDVLNELRERGFKLGLLTDCTSEILDVWPELPYGDLFDSVVRSCQTGWRKPDPRMYRAILRHLGLEAATCLYVGDGGSSELNGAMAVGMRPVLLRAQGEDYFRYDENPPWQGETIARLSEVLPLLTRAAHG